MDRKDHRPETRQRPQERDLFNRIRQRQTDGIAGYDAFIAQINGSASGNGGPTYRKT